MPGNNTRYSVFNQPLAIPNLLAEFGFGQPKDLFVMETMNAYLMTFFGDSFNESRKLFGDLPENKKGGLYAMVGKSLQEPFGISYSRIALLTQFAQPIAGENAPIVFHIYAQSIDATHVIT
jgi:hypothetical protein